MPAVNDTYSVVAGQTLTVGLAQSDQMAVSLVASRVSGPAPLAVHFDATSTTHVTDDAFRQVGYYFHYDDEQSEVWTYGDGASKNVDYGGPLGAHVFKTPGTYAVRVRARDAAGEVEDAEVTITVTDPDVIFSGSTIDITAGTSWPTWASNTRYRLAAGSDYTSHGDIIISGNIENVQVIKVGSGADPIVSGISLSTFDPGVGSETRQIVVQDVNSSGECQCSQAAENILFHRCTMFQSGSDHTLGLGTGSFRSSTFVAVVDCDISGTNPTAANIFGYMGKNTFMGNVIRGTAFGGGNAYHNLRNWWANNTIYQYNWLYDQGGTSPQNLKMHSGGSTSYSEHVTTSGVASRYNVVRQCQFGNGNNSNAAVTFAPENGDAGTSQGLEDIIIEDCTFLDTGVADVAWAGRRLTSRNSGRSPSFFSFVPGLPGGSGGPWDGPYYYETSSITTESPR